jgi:hypothetical protein
VVGVRGSQKGEGGNRGAAARSFTQCWTFTQPGAHGHHYGNGDQRTGEKPKRIAG